LNEVEISESDFVNVRGIQSVVKDSVKSAIAKINQAEFGWPFNAAEHTQELTVGQSEYTWPEYYKISDWSSFQILKDDSLGTDFQALRYIDRDSWYESHRDKDYSTGSAGRAKPSHVFAGHGNGFGVTPSPDKAYSIRFRYFLNYSDLTAHNDITRIPTSFDTVVVDGALYHLYMFKDNLEAAQAAFIAFERGIKDLQTLYINNYEYIRDTRVRY
jgi:hypothetical protein